MWFIWAIPAGLRNRAWLLSVSFLFALALITIGCSTKGQPYSLEERAYEIDRSLICPVCPGETIAQSQVLLAKQMRDIVREKLAAGESKEQILQFFVDRYGTMVLAAPPKKGFNLIVWIVPPAVLVLGALGLVLAIRNMGKHASTLYEQEQSAREQELEPYLSVVDRELEELETPGGGDKGNPESARRKEGGS